MATYDIAVEINTVIREGMSQPVQIIQNQETSFKFDILVDPLGRCGRVTDKLKLAQQLTFAIVNRRTASFLKIFRAQEYRAVILAAIESFKQNQMSFVSENDTDLQGWDIYKLDLRTNQFVKLNQDPIVQSFVDTAVRPGRLETYRIDRRSRRFNDRGVSVEIVEITPPVSGGTFDIRQNFTVFPERKAITFFFSSNRTFTRGEILLGVEDVTVVENPEDPRNAMIRMKVRTLEGEQINITTPTPIRQGLNFV